MKIGIFVSIGELERFGYHHIHEIVLKSFCSFADKVLIISSSRNADLTVKSPKIQFVSSPQTWFDLDENGNEYYSLYKLTANSNLCLDMLAQNNFDIAIPTSINQYIPETNFESIRNYIQKFFQRDKPFTWLYKMYQCDTQLFEADRRLPWVYNLHHRKRYMIAPDSMLYFRNWLLWHSTKKVTIKSGKFRAFNNISIVDVVGEFTEKECEALWTFVKDRGGYNPDPKPMFSVNGVYSHDVYLKYMTHKLKAKRPSSERLDAFGAAICERSKPDFVCHELLRRLEL